MSLRARLFLSFGLILLLLSILSYFLPNWLIKSDLNKAALKIKDVVLSKEQNAYRAISLFIEQEFDEVDVHMRGLSLIFLENASFAQKLNEESGKQQLFSFEKLLPYSSNLAFIQTASSAGEQIALAPIHAYPYTTQLTPVLNGYLVTPSKSQELISYFAVPIPSEASFYLLFEKTHLQESALKSDSTWSSIYNDLQSIVEAANNTPLPGPLPIQEDKNLSSSVEKRLTQAIIDEETKWLEVLTLIHGFLPWYVGSDQLVPDGYMQITSTNAPKLILSKDIFRPVELTPSQGRLSYEAGTGNLFTTQNLKVGNKTLEVGYLLSDILRRMTASMQKNGIFQGSPNIIVGYDAEGNYFDPAKEGFPLKDLTSLQGVIEWNQTSYHYQQFTLDTDWHSQFYVLIPSDQMQSIGVILNTTGKAIVEKISSNLFGVSLLVLGIGLIFLSMISKRVTEPIRTLVLATEEIERGNYEGVALPALEQRQDEVSVLAKGFEKMIAALKDREKIRGVLNMVVSKEIASEILKSKIELGGEERIVSVLFSDIRGFTKMSGSIPPQTLINHMNLYLTEMCRIIDEQGGVIDKFVGDEIMALYGAPLPSNDHALKAISTAIIMISRLRKSNETRVSKGLPPIEIGIGIHTGVVVAGNVGSENRLNYTVLGATVNIGSRLCSAAKPMQILISEETLNAPRIKDAFIYEPVPSIPLKGVVKEVKMFEVKGFKQ